VTKARKTVLTITGATRPGSRWSVVGKNRRGRVLRFSSPRGDFGKGQKVAITHHTIKRDGTLVGARFSSLENITISKKAIEGKQERTRRRSWCRAVAKILEDYRNSLGDWQVGIKCRSGKIKIEGFVIEVNARKLSWFRMPDGTHQCFGLQVANWIYERKLR
jgi:hypothetical protein